MKKKIKNEKGKKEAKQESSETTGTESVETGEATGTEPMSEVKKVDRCTLSFPNEDLNKLVEKINEIIEHVN